MKVSALSIVAVIAIIVICLAAGIAGGALTRQFGASDHTISYVDFISILLTAISVLMTLLAFFLAVVGIVGWNAISNGAHRRVEKFLEEGFRDGNHLHNMVKDRVRDTMYEGIDSIDTSVDSAEEDND